MPDTISLSIEGMSCINCQTRITRKLLETEGVEKAEVSYTAGKARVTYDPALLTPDSLVSAIGDAGYEASSEQKPSKPGFGRIAGIAAIVVFSYLLLEQSGVLNALVPSQLAESNMGLGMMFVIGLVTSVHCLAMCGGINLSQCVRAESDAGKGAFLATARAPFLYNVGRVLSYTIIGFAAGALGSVLTFSPFVQGMMKLAAGVVMLVMGMNLMGIVPSLRRLSPRIPRRLSSALDGVRASGKGPFVVGLLNGLMPCGPLQAMQIYALSTANPATGALSMLLFSLGTVPLVFGLGTLGSALGRKFTHKAMAVGAVLVMVLGLSMLSQGWSLSGITLPSLPSLIASQTQESGGQAVIEDGVQLVDSTLSSGTYPDITVQAGMPVKWTITAPDGSINGCNNRMLIPTFNLEHRFQTGENVIEFTPTETGTYSYSCWMGMIHGTIRVT